MTKIKSLKNFAISDAFTKQIKFRSTIIGSRATKKGLRIFGVWLLIDNKRKVHKSGDLWTYVKGNVYKTSRIRAHAWFPIYFRLFTVSIPYADLEDSNIHNRMSAVFLDKEGNGFVRQVWFSFLPGIRGRGKVRAMRVLEETGSTIYLRQSVANKAYITHRRTIDTDYRKNNRKVTFAYWLSLPFRGRNLILIYEKESMKYEESAATLYEGLLNRGYKNVYFVIDRKSTHGANIAEKFQDKVLIKHTLKHYLCFFIARTFIGTERPAHALDLRVANKHAVRKISSKRLRYVFLQHGVMYMISLASAARADARKGQGGTPPFTRIVTSSVAEADHFINDGNYDREDLYITGLPKFDRTFRNDDASRIMIMPTWRPWEYNLVRTAPAKTGYYKMLTSIMSAIPTDLLSKVQIMPHPLFLRELQQSDLAQFIKPFNSYDEVLRDTDLLITDYSSVSCDAFFRGSNVIFWWKDKDLCMEHYGGHLMINEENIFGDIAYNEDDITKMVRERYGNAQPQEHIERFNHIVNFKDDQNTERVIKCLINDGLLDKRVPGRKRTTVMTYGTFDRLQHSHVNLLKRARALGDYLIVGLSTNTFSEEKGKKTKQDYSTRKFMLEALRDVDLVVPEENWDQKVDDLKKHRVDLVVMSEEWKDSPKIKALRDQRVRLEFLERTAEKTNEKKVERTAPQYKPREQKISKRRRSNAKQQKQKTSRATA